MSYTEKALRGKEAKEAIGEGVLAWITTGNLNNGIDAMLKTGKKNGSYNTVKTGIVLDVLKKISDNLR